MISIIGVIFFILIILAIIMGVREDKGKKNNQDK
jgi:hypothetical protein